MLQLYCCPFVRHDSVVRTCVAAARAYAAMPSWHVTTATQAHSASSPHWTCVAAARAYAATPSWHVTTATQAHSASSPHWTCVAAARAYAAMPSWRVTTATQAHSASSPHWTCVAAARAYAATPSSPHQLRPTQPPPLTGRASRPPGHTPPRRIGA